MVRVAVVEAEDLLPRPRKLLVDRESLPRVNYIPPLAVRLGHVRGPPDGDHPAGLRGGTQQEAAALLGIGLARMGFDGSDLPPGEDDDQIASSQ